MALLEVLRALRTQEQALEYLEAVRWQGLPACPYCGSTDVGAHASGDRANSRWQCHSCTRAFSVTVGTLFHGTHVPLRDWFLVLSLMLHSKDSASAYQIARDIGRRRATVWSMMRRIRAAIEQDPAQADLLYKLADGDQAAARIDQERADEEGEHTNATGGHQQ